MGIAIIGMACLFPGAPDLERYWRNIVDGVDAIGEVPAGRWERGFYDPSSTAADRFYCRRGGFVDDHADFDPLAFGVMPKAVEAIEPDQLLTLRIGQQALQDAGYQAQPFARERTGVIIGRGNYVTPGVLRLQQRVRLLPQILQILRDLFPDLSPAAEAAVTARLESQLTHYGPDVAADLIPNLIASRLANRLDLHGPAYAIDAACASSLIAIEQACASLHRGETDMMLVGGAHLTHDLTFWATFCQLGALSRRGTIRPLADDADGILAGEGVGMVVLKRLDEALRDGDRIYATIEGVASSSDGRSSSLVAPSSAGQLLALQRAWKDLPFDRESIGLLEAHGTATPTGDAIELETIAEFFGPQAGESPRPVIGSVKSMIGHAMPASGMASLIKTALSIHHGLLPPTLHCEKPHPRLPATRFRVIARTETWQQQREQRVAALNAFGFGGINAHVVLRGAPRSANTSLASATTVPSISGLSRLPGLLVLSADTPQALLVRFDRGESDAQACGTAARCRLVVIEPNPRKLETARRAIVAGKPWNGRQQIWFSPQGLIEAGGKLAYVFPGVDSLFDPRAADLAAHFGRALPPYCEKLDPAQSLPHLVVGLLGFNRFVFDILSGLGIRADACAGHSVGEWSAMLCSGMMEQALSDRANAGLDFDALRFPDVQYLAVNCNEPKLRAAMTGLDRLTISHDNCPHQVIACGRRESIDELALRLRAAGIVAHRLPFVSGFHSPLFAEHMQWYRDFFGSADLAEPVVQVWSATTARPYPAGMTAKRSLALEHLLAPVRFRSMIEAMYEDGYRVFVQVGTGSLTGFIDDTLTGRPHHAIQANHERRSGLEQLQQTCAALWVEGASFDTSLLGTAQVLDKAESGSAPATQKLSLGVPLLRVSEPLEWSLRPQAMRAADAILPDIGANDGLDDPVGQMVRQTLADIEQAGREVLQMWQQHRLARQPQAAGSARSPRIVRVVQRLLDPGSTASCVRDHGLYPQREGWPILADCYPVVPLTMEVMLVREAVEEALPDFKVIEVADIKAYNWLALAEAVTVDIQLRSIDDSTIETEILGYFRARVTIAREYPATDACVLPELLSRRETAVTAADLYAKRWMFHGPAYQGVQSFAGIGDNGIDGLLRVPSGKGSLLDNMGQLAGYWVMEQPDNCLAMPTAVDRIRFFGADPLPGETLHCQVRIDALDAHDCVSSHRLRDAAGKVRVAIDGWRTRRYQMDKAFWVASRLLSHHEVSQFVPPDVAVFDDRYDTALLRDYLSRRYLTQRERAAYEQLPPGNRRQWLNGRVAAKDAVCGWLRRQHGVGSVFPQELCIIDDDAGNVLIQANVTATVPGNLQIAIAHHGNWSAAIVAEQAVGIRMEAIGGSGERSSLPVAAGDAIPEGEAAEIADARARVAKAVAADAMAIDAASLTIEIRNGDCYSVSGHWVVTHLLRNSVIGWSLVVADPTPGASTAAHVAQQ